MTLSKFNEVAFELEADLGKIRRCAGSQKKAQCLNDTGEIMDRIFRKSDVPQAGNASNEGEFLKIMRQATAAPRDPGDFEELKRCFMEMLRDTLRRANP